MAGNMKKNLNRQNGTSGSDAKNSSRVSGAADVTPARIQSTRVEQRSSLPNNKRGSSSSASKGSGRGKQAAGSGSRKKPSGSRSSYSPPQDGTGDSQFIRTAVDQWNGMEAHQRQRIFSVLLLLLSLLLFGSLTLFRHTPVLKTLSDFFITFFGWGAYLLALGLVAFSVAHLVEGIQRRVFVSWRLVLGLSCIWLILLTESRLIMGHMSVGILAELLVAPLLGWGAAVGHLLLIGLLVIFVIFTFRITLGQMIAVSQNIFHAITHDPRQQADAAEPEEDLSDFMGKRPQYSRYGATPLPPALPEERANTPAMKRGATKPPAPRRSPQIEANELEDDEDSNIEFEADFEDDDPENDINVLKSKVGFVPKGPRAPIDTRVEAVKGAKQSPLPFQPPQEEDEGGEPQEPLILSPNNTRNRGKMEDLQPNPSKIPVSVQPRTRAAQAPAPIPESPWKLPDTSLLNNPEEVKQHMLGDDTAALARTIQETLRSFRVDAEVRAEDISIGPTVIRFGIRPTGKPEMTVDDKGRPTPVRDAQGNIIYETRTRVSRIMALQNDLALVLEAKTIRMEAPVPGRPYVGVEIPNKNSRLVTLREVLESKEYQIAKSKSKLAIALGKDVAGQVRVSDLARMPHLLIAGATGAGKCLAFDEPVFLADGRIIKVQELLGKSEQVIGVTDTQTMSQVPVLATFTDNGIQEVFEIELDNGVIIRRTGEHPLWAASLDENQHVGQQSNGKATRRTRAIDAGWVQTKDLRVCGNRPHFAGHVILCPLNLQQQGTVARSDADVILCAALLSDCPQGYEWHKIADIRRIVAPTVNIEVHSENHAFVGYAVEHNSVAINIIIASIITHAVPDDVRMLMVDPKMVELSMYNGIPHLLAPVVIEVDKVVSLLRNAINEMERRYRLFSQLGVRNLDGYRKLRAEKLAKGDESLSNMPAIVIIIDELADLMMAAPEEVEGMICRLAQLARATGIHLVIATQRPSVDVITGLIKANIPTRISFMVSSAVDSRTIIDMGGAERLLGRGDMLYLPADAGRPERIQCSFLTDDEAEKLVAFWREQVTQHAVQAQQAKSQGQGDPALAPTQPQIEPGWEIKEHHSDEFELDDDLLEQAEEIVREFGKASISLLQRRLRIGYSRAARLIDLLEERGIIGHAESGGRGREVFEGGGSGNDRFGEGHSIADEVADITAEERARDEFLKKQQASLHNNQSPSKDNQ